jgi:hypothetical protein
VNGESFYALSIFQKNQTTAYIGIENAASSTREYTSNFLICHVELAVEGIVGR